MFKKSWLLLGLLGVLALGSSLVYLPYVFSSAEAQSGQTNVRPVTGYAYSSTVGLIRFDHDKQNPVVIQSDGNFTGYAWSNNIGWIDFNPSEPYPAGGSNNSVRLVDSNVTGWARVCAGMIASGANQSDPNNVCAGNSRTDGWDGWILFDHNRSQPVTRNEDGSFRGFAWGSNVVGWVNMALANYDNGDPPPPPIPPCIQDSDGNWINNPAYLGTADCGNGGGTCPPNCPDPDSSLLRVLVTGDQAGDVSVDVYYDSTSGPELCIASADQLCNLQVVVGSQVVIESNIVEPTSWGNEGPCVGEEGDNCSFNKSIEEESVNIVFGSDDEFPPVIVLPPPGTDSQVCVPFGSGQNARCSFFIDCSLAQFGCGSSNYVYSTPVTVVKNYDDEYSWNHVGFESDWPFGTILTGFNSNNPYQIGLVFCSDLMISSCSSDISNFDSYEGPIYFRLRVINRSLIPVRFTLPVGAVNLENNLFSEIDIYINYIESNVGQKSD